MIEKWIDVLAKVWEISDFRGGTVRSFRIFERNEFPEALTLDFPCALSYPTELRPEYSTGGPCLDFWDGTTEFHLSASVSKDQFPYLIRFFAAIRAAAAANLTLGNRVDDFLIKNIRGPLGLRYGEESEHFGLLVYWQVKENVSGDFIVSGGV